MRRAILDALKARYEAEIAEADATINIYLDHPVAIGEHPQHIEEVNKLVDKIAQAKEKIEVLEEFEPDYAWKTWGNESKKFCKEHNLEQSDWVGFAFGGDEHKELNRGTEVNRLCISKHIGDYIH